MAINKVIILVDDTIKGLENKINDWLYINKAFITNVSISHSSVVNNDKYLGVYYTYSAIICYEKV